MIPRTRFDIGWRDLVHGYKKSHTLRADRLAAQRALEEHWSPGGDCLASLSLRSGFDIALAAYDFPPGSEVLMSCMNIGPMGWIVEEHGLRPTPIDLDMGAVSMRPELIERAITPNTKAIVHAHVLGTRQPLGWLREICDKHGLVLFEDCAQAYRTDDWRGDPRSDVTMFSFGPLKTCSAMMGGILRYRDKAILDRARVLQAKWPVQTHVEFIDRLIFFAELLFLTQELPYTVIVNLARWLGLEEYVNTPVRNFRGSRRRQFRKSRKQPGYALLSFMLYRLKTYDRTMLDRRIEAAQTLLATIPGVDRPGRDAADHGYWLFPICCDDPVGLRKHLHRHGFDSTLGHKTFVVLEPPAGREAFDPVEAKEVKRRALYLPIHYRAPKEAMVRLAEAIRAFDPECSGDRCVLEESGDGVKAYEHAVQERPTAATM